MNSYIKTVLATLATLLLATGPSVAQSAFVHGWTLDPASSHLNFITVKKGKVMEASHFATLEGRIDQNGAATFDVLLDSIDTKIDLRNVRMRFLMFETFAYPKATVTAQLTEEMLDGLNADRVKAIDLPITLDLHGVTKELTASVLVKLGDNDNVTVTSAKPIVLSVSDFNLSDGLAKLEEAAEVTIVPSTAITFGLSFARNSTTDRKIVASVAAPADTAIEPAGNFDAQACETRFTTVSQSGSISFSPNSADLQSASAPLLNSVAAIVEKCPGMVIQIAGHTDNRGSADYNLALSKDRAAAVVSYLTALGVPDSRFVSRGFGETQPIANNATRLGRSKNRRIEFVILSSGQNN